MTSPHPLFGHQEYTIEEHLKISNLLQKSLGPEFISSRPGPSNSKINYIEGWKSTNLANQVFGFNGWSNSVISTTVDYVDVDPVSGKISCGLSTLVRITLKDGSFREDVGYGSMENAAKKSAAFEKAKKESVTDAMKRALKSFGPAMGGCLVCLCFYLR